MNISPSRHSPTGGSNAKLWWYCAAAPTLCSNIAKTTNRAMQLGTQMHENAASLLMDPMGKVPHKLTKARQAEVEDYVRDMLELSGPSEFAVEHEVVMEGFPEAFSTIDFYIPASPGCKPTIIDLKTGRAPVSPENNEQLITCAVFAGITTDCLVGIWQHGKLETALVTGLALDFHRERITRQLTAVRNNAGPTPGDHCAGCPARLICPARQTTQFPEGW